MSGLRSRAKGLKGEREVADAFEQRFWTVRGLENKGDALCVLNTYDADPPRPLTLHIECKRAELWKPHQWIEQASTEAPPGVPWLLCMRRNRSPWYGLAPLDDLLRLIG